jgi:hypothetical protein
LKGGLFGSRRRFVPVRGACEWGEQILVAYDEDQVKSAPGIEADGELTASEEQQLYRHYGISPGSSAAPGEPADGMQETAFRDAAGAPVAQEARARDDAMTRSEEELRVVGHETRPRERARLKKYQVTDYVTMRVPVTREEIRLEREPVQRDEPERVVEPIEDEPDP